MLDISFFRGSRPKLEPHLLDAGESQKAVNCRLQTGALQAFRDSLAVQALNRVVTKTIHRFGDTNFWFEFADDVNAAEGPIASDTESTTYFTGDGEPAMTYASIATAGAAPYPTNRYRLGIPEPDSIPTVAVNGTGEGDPSTRSYLLTYVSARSEEGPPTFPTDNVDVADGQTVAISDIPVAPAGNYNITAKRIYRLASASGDSEYLLIAEIPVAQTTFTDNIPLESNLGAIKSTEWYPPPDDMIGLTSLANGVMAGFTDKTLYLSEPNRPHAWPYFIVMDRPIVGLVGITGGVVVATDGQPVIVAFTHPSAASQIEIETPRACISKRSMVDMGEYAIYATGEGLVAVDASRNAPLITQNVLDKYQWQRFNPSSMHAYRKDGWYLCFYQGLDGDGGFAITAQGDAFFELDFYASAGFTDEKTGDLYLAVDGNIVQWDADNANLISFAWTSAVVLLPKPMNMSCARVDADAYPVTFELYEEGVLHFALSVTSSEPFWLPDNIRMRRYHIALKGTNTVRRAIVADSMDSLT